MIEHVLITGASGFIGSHVTRYLLNQTDWRITGLDRYSVSGNPHRLTDAPDFERHKRRVALLHHDLRSPINAWLRQRIGKVDYVLHLGASTHVDRAIRNPLEFVYDNVVGTANLLNYCRRAHPSKVMSLSTVEVFGPALRRVSPTGNGTDTKSSNPYSASKAGGEELAIAFHNTYRVPVLVTHTMNVFGEMQHPEKFIPLCIRRIIQEETVTIHADAACQCPGSRFYIYAKSVAQALLFLLDKGMPWRQVQHRRRAGNRQPDARPPHRANRRQTAEI